MTRRRPWPLGRQEPGLPRATIRPGRSRVFSSGYLVVFGCVAAYSVAEACLEARWRFSGFRRQLSCLIFPQVQSHPSSGFRYPCYPKP